MKNLKHTKGNWELMCTELIGAIWIRGNDKMIAHISADNEDKDFPNKDEAIANGKLIASAPELLEALKPFAELLKQFDGQIRNRVNEGIIHAWSHNKHGEAMLTVEMLQTAYNAIKKATE